MICSDGKYAHQHAGSYWFDEIFHSGQTRGHAALENEEADGKCCKMTENGRNRRPVNINGRDTDENNIQYDF